MPKQVCRRRNAEWLCRSLKVVKRVILDLINRLATCIFFSVFLSGLRLQWLRSGLRWLRLQTHEMPQMRVRKTRSKDRQWGRENCVVSRVLHTRVVGTKPIGPKALYIQRYVPSIYFCKKIGFRALPEVSKAFRFSTFFFRLTEVEQLFKIVIFLHFITFSVTSLLSLSSIISYGMSFSCQPTLLVLGRSRLPICDHGGPPHSPQTGRETARKTRIFFVHLNGKSVPSPQ